MKSRTQKDFSVVNTVWLYSCCMHISDSHREEMHDWCCLLDQWENLSWLNKPIWLLCSSLLDRSSITFKGGTSQVLKGPSKASPSFTNHYIRRSETNPNETSFQVSLSQRLYHMFTGGWGDQHALSTPRAHAQIRSHQTPSHPFGNIEELSFAGSYPNWAGHTDSVAQQHQHFFVFLVHVNMY